MPASDPPPGSLTAAASRPPLRFVHALAFAATHAVLFAGSFPPVGAWPLVVIALAPWAYVALHAASARQLFAAVFITQLGMWLWLSRWMAGVTALGYPAFCLYMSIWPALAALFLRRLHRNRRFTRWPLALTLPIVWVGQECLRGEIVFHGYPWYLAGHPLIDWPVLVQSADLFGVYFISFLVAAINGLIADDLRRRWGPAPSARLGPAAVVLGLALAANLAYGIVRLTQTAGLAPGPRLLLIQTNLPQDNKTGWTTEQRIADFQRFLAQTDDALAEARAAGEPPDLVVWPETMFPGFGFEPDGMARIAIISDFANLLIAHQRASGLPWLVGSPAYVGLKVGEDGEVDWEKRFNSAYLVQGEPPFARYDKYFLTPFGETMPYISAWPWLEQRLLALGAEGMTFSLDSSDALRLLQLDGSDGPTRLATPICFEDTVARVCRRMIHPGGTKRAHAIVNLSNDGWFGRFDDGRAMHALVARFRCIENRVPMVRAANTGYTIAVDSRGNVVGRIGPGRYGQARRTGSLLAHLQLDSRRTIFSRLGDVWAWGTLLLAVAAGLATFHRSTTR